LHPLLEVIKSDIQYHNAKATGFKNTSTHKNRMRSDNLLENSGVKIAKRNTIVIILNKVKVKDISAFVSCIER
jgi:hypothetical protein